MDRAVKFDVDKALRNWERRYPNRGERIVVLRGMLYEAEDKHSKNAEMYPKFIKNLRLMLAAEGAQA